MNWMEARELELRLAMHEHVCAERYDKIFSMLEEQRKELKELRQLASMGSGAWKAIVGLGVLLTITLTSIKIFILTNFKE